MEESCVADLVQGLWIGPKLSSMEKLCIHSFLKHGHPFHLYVYDQVDGVPAHTKLCDANKIVPSSRIFFYSQHHSCSGFANMFRYKLLLERGGWWVDMDTVCFRTFSFSDPYVFSSESTSAEPMRYCWDHCDRADNASLRWGETVPKPLARAVGAYCLADIMHHPNVFFP